MEHTGKLQTEKTGKNDIKWTELLKRTDKIREVQKIMVEKMKKHYNFRETDGRTLFELPNNTIMEIDTFHGETESCLIMDYTSPGDNDDGGQFYPIDFSSPDEMFEAMLEETKL